jgi:hypothetical protein
MTTEKLVIGGAMLTATAIRIIITDLIVPLAALLLALAGWRPAPSAAVAPAPVEEPRRPLALAPCNLIEITPEMVAKYKNTKEELATLKRPSETGCHICSGTSYFGRTAIFELASGEMLRKYIAKKADANVLRQAAAKDGMKPLKDEGMRLVLDGTTAMEEMQRVFAPKSGSESGGSSR